MTTGPPGVGRESHNRELLLRLGTWEVVGFVGWLVVCLYLPCQHNNDKNKSKVIFYILLCWTVFRSVLL